jgi:ribonuclease HI
MSNNVAEYLGLTQALTWLLKESHQEKRITFFGDNKMTVMQMDGKWRAKQGLYIPFYKRALEIRKKFKKLNFEWIPREQNGEADELSKGELIKRKVQFKIQPQ